MASIEERLLVPDEKIQSEIFPSVKGLQPASCNVISNTFETCTFRIQPGIVQLPGYPRDLIVRLEMSENHVAVVAALQRLARSQLNDLVPKVLHIGAASSAAGKQVDFFVTEYLTETVPFETVWDTLDEIQQLELVNTAVLAVGKLQSVDVNTLCQSLAGTPFVSADNDSTQPVKTSIGGPALGYFPDLKQFLKGILQDTERKGCELSETADGVTIQSAYADIGSVDLTCSDFEELHRHVAFCHNDLEPRNILVKEVSPGKYDLVGLIDWEMAGLFPFACEIGVKDADLGLANLSFSWYRMLRDQTLHLIPQAECHAKMIKALRIIKKSRLRLRQRNVGVRVQEKWIEREQIEESSDPRRGWVRKAGVEPPKSLTREEISDLELNIAKELGFL